MTALVRGVINDSTDFGSIHNELRSTSAKTGTALTQTAAPAVATQVSDGTITSSTASIPMARKMTFKVTLPLAASTAYRAPAYAAHASPNFVASGPGAGYPPQRPLETARATAWTSRSLCSGQVGQGAVRMGLPPRIASMRADNRQRFVRRQSDRFGSAVKAASSDGAAARPTDIDTSYENSELSNSASGSSK